MESENYFDFGKSDQNFGKESPKESISDFSNDAIPYKIRKIELLKNCGLETPFTEFIDVGLISNLEFKLKERLTRNNNPLVIRFATIPNRYSLPAVYLSNERDLKEVVEKIKKIVDDDHTISHLIVRDHAGQENIDKRIVGRYSLSASSSLPENEILEFYPGAVSISILEKVSEDDPNYIRVIKEVGKFPRLDVSKPYLNYMVDYNQIKEFLDERMSKLLQVKKVVAFTKNKDPNNIEVCFEFYVIDNNIFFSDFE